MDVLNQNHQRTLTLTFRYPAEAADFASRLKKAALHDNQVTRCKLPALWTPVETGRAL